MAARVLARLSRLNRTAVFLGVAVLVFAALLLGGWFGFLVLLALAAAVGALFAASWPRLNPSGRAARAVIIGLLLAVALARLTR